MDFLQYGAGLITGLGFDTVKLELSTAYNTIKYPNTTFTGTPSTLQQLAEQSAYHAVFSDPLIARVQINTFSLAVEQDNPWAGAWTTAVGDSIESEFYDLCVHLRNTYPGKEFILQSWESDWQLLNSFNPNDSVPIKRLAAFRDYSRRRQRALRAAIADTPESTCALKYAIECNRVRDRMSFRVVTDVLENVDPDMVSLSVYEAIEGWTQGITEQAALEDDIADKLERIVARVRAEAGNVPIVIGEYGFPQLAPYWPGFDVGALHQVVIDTADALGVEGEIFWQVIDNEEYAPGMPRGFALYERNGNSSTVGALTESGAFYQSLLGA
jgi:hypothetical protein